MDYAVCFDVECDILCLVVRWWSLLPILSLSGVDRHDRMFPGFYILCVLWISLVFLQIASHSIHPSILVWAFFEVPTHPPSLLFILSNISFASSHRAAIPAKALCVSCVVTGLSFASLLDFSFLVRYFLALLGIHLSIFISGSCAICCFVLRSVQSSVSYIKVGVMPVLYTLLISLNLDLLVTYCLYDTMFLNRDSKATSTRTPSQRILIHD